MPQPAAARRRAAVASAVDSATTAGDSRILPWAAPSAKASLTSTDKLRTACGAGAEGFF